MYKDIILITLFSNNITDSQPSTLKRIWATAYEHCRVHNESLVSLNNLNNTGSSLTDLLIQQIWSSVDGKYTSWIAYIGKWRRKLILDFTEQ